MFGMRRKESVVGLDIGPTKIIAVVLKKTLKGLCITHLASTATPSGAIEGGIITDPKSVGLAVKDLFLKSGIKSKDIMVACGGAGIILHLSKMPLMSDGEIKKATKAQLSKFVVFAGFPVVSDYNVIDTITEGDVKKANVLLVASKKAILDSYVKVAMEAKLNLIGIDEVSLAMTRALYDSFVSDASDETLVAVMVGFDYTVISIFEEAQLYYIHIMDIGIKNESEREIKEFLVKFIPDMESIVKYYKSQSGQTAKIRKILLDGEVDGIFKLSKDPDRKITASGIPIERGDPLSHIKFAGDNLRHKVAEENLPLTRAIGLAMNGMNLGNFPINISLLPVEVGKIREWGKRLQHAAYFFVVMSIGAALALLALHLNIGYTKRQIEEIKNGVQNLPLAFDKALALEQKCKIFLTDLAVQDDLAIQAKFGAWSETLNEIRTIIPKGLRLTSIETSMNDSIIFQGEALLQEAAFDFERVLKESPYFKEVKLGVVQGVKGSQGQGLVQFTITCVFKKEE